MRATDMIRAGPVAGFATDTNFGPGGRIPRIVRIVIFTHIGGVALDAAAVRIGQVTRPKKSVLGVDLFAGLQVIPALSALLGGTTVPGDVQRLQMPFADIDQILLQRVVPEGVVDFKNAGSSILADRRHHEILTLAIKPGFDSMEFDRGIIEVTEYGILVRGQHGPIVIRQLPLRVLGLMTL